MEFLSKLDPNLVAVLITAVTTVGGWLYRKAKGEKQEDITDALWHALEGKVIAIAESNVESGAALIRERLTKAAYEALERMGMKKSPLVDAIVAKLVERGVTEVRKRIAALKNARTLDAMLASAAAVRDALTPPAVPTVPPLELPTATIMCPLPGCNQVKDHDTPHGIVTGATL